MEEIHKLRAQISNIVQTNFPDSNAGFVANLLPPNALQVRHTEDCHVKRVLLTPVVVESTQTTPSGWFYRPSCSAKG